MLHTFHALLVVPAASSWILLPTPSKQRFLSTELAFSEGNRPRAPPCKLADPFVLERLGSIKNHYNELTAQLEDPEIMANVDQLTKVSRERAKLEATVTSFDTYTSLEAQLAEAKAMFAEVDDAEIREMAREEVRELENQLAQLDDDLKLLLLPTDPNDDKNVMVEIRAGTGGDEAAIWASDLLKIYTKYSESQGWAARVVSISESEAGALSAIAIATRSVVGYPTFLLVE